MNALIIDIVAHTGLGLAVVAPAVLWARGRRRDGIRLAAALAVAAVAVLSLQFILLRPRPGGGPLYTFGLPFYSFPSGHAGLAFTAAAYIACLRRGWGGLAAVGAAVAVAAARVAADVHFPTDVVGGGALGIGIAVAAFGAGRPGDTRPVWSWLLFPWLGLMVTMGAWATAGIGSVDAMFFPQADKVLHLLIFGISAFLAVGWFDRSPALRILAIILAGVLLEELAQGALPNRSVDPLDALASGLGVALFGLAATFLRGRSRSRRNLAQDGPSSVDESCPSSAGGRASDASAAST